MRSLNMKSLFCLVGLFTAGMLLLAGCAPSDESGKSAPAANVPPPAGGHGHHDHVHGPNNGEMFEVPDAELKGEWVARYGDNMVTFFFYEPDGKTKKRIPTDMLKANRKITDVETFEIEAVDFEDGAAHKFEIVDETFAIAMKTTGVNLEMDLDGKQHQVKLDKDPHQ